MTYGIEIRSASGAERLAPGDFIHRLVTTGSIAVTSGGTNPEYFVAVSGMSATDEWLVVATNATAVRFGSGGFYAKYYGGSFSDTIYYSVYRR